MKHLVCIVPRLGAGKGSKETIALGDSPFCTGCHTEGDGAGRGSTGGALLPGWLPP